MRYLVLNDVTDELEEREGDLLVGYSTLPGLAARLRRDLEPGYTFVKLVSAEVTSAKYEMGEEDFFRYAHRV
jgi:hypothetical protein